MAKRATPKPERSYPPKKPETPVGGLVATRRQMLTGILSGGALFGCSGSEKSAATGTGGAGQNALSGGASGVGGSSIGGSSAGGQTGIGGSSSGGSSSGGETSGGEASGGEASQEEGSGGAASGGEASQEEGSGGAPAATGKLASDQVPLGNTGIMVSRLAMGSGTTGFDGSSQQTRMGEAFSDLLVDSYGLGINFWEAADVYGSHGVVGEAVRRVGRENIVLMTKTMANTRSEAEADLSRFMDELGTESIDIVLLHIRERESWPQEAAGAMEALSEAKANGLIRAHGVSCHSLAALQSAASLDWVDVHLARINPFQLHMDADPQTIIRLLEGEKAKGKGVIGMKILAQGDAVDRLDQCIEHATKLGALDCFTIGFTSRAQLDEIVRKISEVQLG